MRQPLQLVVGLLACLAVASALPGLFPREKITTYKYYGDVKAGTIEPATFASQFVITGLMHVIPETSDPNLKNAFYIILNVTHGIRNGEITHFENILENTLPVPDAAKVLNEPFVVVFDDDGKVENLMVKQDEAGWSRNIKRSIASMLQLDLASMDLEMPIKPHGFITKENTIYGECTVTYDLHRTTDLGENHFTVTKFMEPMGCTKFHHHVFNLQEAETCFVENEEEMTSTSGRIFHIENNGEDLLIKTLIAHGVINYFPWRAQSEAHYILANQTIELLTVNSIHSITLPSLNLTEFKEPDKIQYQPSRSFYAPDAGVDLTFGRHVVDPQVLISKLIKMLGEADDYANESNLDMTSPETEHEQILNRIIDTMSYMDLQSLEQIFQGLQDSSTEVEIQQNRTNIFINVIPFVGTNATCLLIRNIIRQNILTESKVLYMLSNLPYNIRYPSESLLIEMEDLLNLGDNIPLEIQQAAILSFATMIYKTYKHEKYLNGMDEQLVEKYIQYIYDRVINEPTFGMKIIYIHAMRNIGIGGVNKLLEPIIRGELIISEKPDKLRLHAMIANSKLVNDYEYVHKLYWPILANTKLPLELRIFAYQIIVSQSTRIERFMNLYWFMVSEKNEHLYNYHYTTIKSLANTVNSCNTPLKEMARKILRFTRLRSISNVRSGAWLFDYEDKKFGFGEYFNVMTVADELTGLPFAAMIELTKLERRKPYNYRSYWIRVEGIDVYDLEDLRSYEVERTYLSVEKIKNILKKAGEDMPSKKPIEIEFGIMTQGRTIYFTEYTVNTIDQFFNALVIIISTVRDLKYGSRGSISFDQLFTMEVPNDIGLSTLLYNKIPHLTSLNLNGNVPLNSKIFKYELDGVIKERSNGYHSMEFYNPIEDTWHAIRRVSAFDTRLPLAFNFSYSDEFLNLTFPLLKLTPPYSVAGMRSHVENHVMVIGGEKNVLEHHCPTCHSTELVTKGEKYRKNVTFVNYNSVDTTLHFGVHQYDCERIVSPLTRIETFEQIMSVDNKNTWNDATVYGAMIISKYYNYLIMNPESGSCGYLIKLEPISIGTKPIAQYLNPTVNMALSTNFKMPNAKKPNVLLPVKINFHGTLETKFSSDLNPPLQYWIIKANFASNQGHFNNHLKIEATRISLGQKNFKICIEGHKIYPSINNEPLSRFSTGKEKVIGKLTFMMGETVDSNCNRDDTVITIHTKAESSTEQNEALRNEILNGNCKKDIENPIYYYNETSIVPRTPACINEALLRSNLRKCTYTVLYKNIHQSFMPTLQLINDFIRAGLLPYATYLSTHTESGIIKIFIEYPIQEKGIKLNVLTPTHELTYTGLGEDDEWGGSMENTRLPFELRDGIVFKEIKFCTIYPDVLLNADGANLFFTVPDKWTLLSGDYLKYVFAVFVKNVEQKKLGLLMTIHNNTIEVIPSIGGPIVTINGEIIDHEKQFIIPNDSKFDINYTLRTIWSYDRLIIQSSFIQFDVEWTERSVILLININQQGRITGLCGHLDGTHKERMAKIYTIDED